MILGFKVYKERFNQSYHLSKLDIIYCVRKFYIQYDYFFGTSKQDNPIKYLENFWVVYAVSALYQADIAVYCLITVEIFYI